VFLEDAFHDDGGGEPPHAGQGGELLVAEGLVGGDVGGGDAEEVVGVAEEPLGVADSGISARPRSKSAIVAASSRSIVTWTRTSKPRPIAAGSTTAR
jgi:hypothetical protein